MVKRVGLLLTLLLITTLLWPHRVHDSPVEPDEFVPVDILHAVALGCAVLGDNGPPPRAIAQIFVKWNKDSGSKLWDFKPVIAMRAPEDGGAIKAAEDCQKWYGDVIKTMKKGPVGEK